MIRNEVQFYHLLKRSLPSVDWCRIENCAGTGMFDLNGCVEGVEFWVELKIIRSRSLACELRPTQMAWATHRQNHGGRLFVFAYRHGAIDIYWSPFAFEKCILKSPVFITTDRCGWENVLSLLKGTLTKDWNNIKGENNGTGSKTSGHPAACGAD